jgi:hypothetical protein
LTIPTNLTDPYNLKERATDYYNSYVSIRSTILERAKEYLESFTQSAVLKYFGDMTIGGTNLYPNSENLFNPSLGSPV